MTSATNELRRLLDERGVKWKDYGHDNHTWWREWYAENRASANGLYVKIEAVLTPEQAIAATLGSGTLTADDVLNAVYKHGARWQAIADELNAELGNGTCHLEETVHQREIATEFGGGYYDETTYDCDECGFENIDYNIRFCGGCGARVVSHEE